ncbi:MAG TPA: GNAT family N-acetyltransferase, partial [Candidatus Binatia bacterium]|nr:GNAT family N-acetyltransferase [Candidatus Binatia bacterium]
MPKKVHIRNLAKEDLPFIADIEERLTGGYRPDYWAKRIEISEAVRPHWASLVAEVEGKVTGFTFGRAG